MDSQRTFATATWKALQARQQNICPYSTCPHHQQQATPSKLDWFDLSHQNTCRYLPKCPHHQMHSPDRVPSTNPSTSYQQPATEFVIPSKDWTDHTHHNTFCSNCKRMLYETDCMCRDADTVYIPAPGPCNHCARPGELAKSQCASYRCEICEAANGPNFPY